MSTSARVLAGLLAWVLSGVPALTADEPPAVPKKVREATAEEVPPVVADLEAAFKKKKAEEALALLAKVEELKHKDFEKPLQKLLRHPDPGVALRGAELLEERTYPDSGKAVWAASWGQAANDKRPGVRAKALRALGRIAFALDKKSFEDVERLWRTLQGNPDKSQGPLLSDIAFYVESTKDKRFARDLAEALDEPMSKDNGPTNPPLAWWEAKWAQWNESKVEVHAAIKALTGEDFDSTAHAREWIEAHKKEGFDW